MAEVASNRIIPCGYDEDFVDACDEDFHCMICHLLSKEPVLTRCGHRFCKECLEECLRRQEQEGYPLTCPADRKALKRDKDIFPDKLAERNILSFLIKCPSDYCEWTGELRTKEDHLAFCPFKAVSCTNENCEVKVAKKDLTKHVTITCQWRIVKCDYCEVLHPECQIKNHLQICEGLLLACPNNCGANDIAREKIPDHVENDCPPTEVRCPYFWIGCHTKIRRQELESHLQCETRHHLDLACCKLKETKEEVGEKARKLYSLERKVAIIQREHLENQNQLEERVGVLQNQREQRVNRLQERVNNQTDINERVNNNHQKVERKLNTHHMALSVCFAVITVVAAALIGMSYSVQLREERVSVLEKTMQCSDEHSNYKWKISGFSKVLRLAQTSDVTAQVLYSAPFYLYGYKCRLKLDPNSQGSGKNSHLSIFFIVMKGEYDATLPWPFHNKVTLTLIDQQENINDRESIVMSFITYPELKENYARPVTDENTGRGYHKFISHDKLRERRYIVDDTIFIQVQLSSPY